jgi:DNA-directed RNA polymerase specialized sigma24 family protein
MSALTKELTDRQAEVWRLRHDERLTFAKIAKRVGISLSGAYRLVGKAEKTLGKNPLPVEDASPEVIFKSKKPLTDLQAEAYRLRHDDRLTQVEIAKRMGITLQGAQKHVKLAEAKLGAESMGSKLPKVVAPVLEVLRGRLPSERVTDNRAAADAAVEDPSGPATVKMLDEKIVLCLSYIDHDLVSKGTLANIGQTVKNLTDVRQIRMGEPTSIVKIQDVRKLEEIGKLLHEEFERRGMLLEGKAEKV